MNASISIRVSGFFRQSCPNAGMSVKMLFLPLQVLTGIAVCLSEDKVKCALIKHEAEEIYQAFSLHVWNDSWACCERRCSVVVELAVALLVNVCCGEVGEEYCGVD